MLVTSVSETETKFSVRLDYYHSDDSFKLLSLVQLYSRLAENDVFKECDLPIQDHPDVIDILVRETDLIQLVRGISDRRETVILQEVNDCPVSEVTFKPYDNQVYVLTFKLFKTPYYPSRALDIRFTESQLDSLISLLDPDDLISTEDKDVSVIEDMYE